MFLGKRLMKSKMNSKDSNISSVFLSNTNDHHMTWDKHDVAGLTVIASFKLTAEHAHEEKIVKLQNFRVFFPYILTILR